MTKEEINALCDEYIALNDEYFELESAVDGGIHFINPAVEAEVKDEYRHVSKKMRELEDVLLKELGYDGFCAMLIEKA